MPAFKWRNLDLRVQLFSAYGMLMTDLRQDFIRTLIRRTDQIEPSELTSFYTEMEALAMDLMKEQNISEDCIVFQRFGDLRYMGQEHTVKVPIPTGEITAEEIPGINERFHQLHEQTYTFRLESPVEFVNYHLTVFGVVEKPDLKKISGKGLDLDRARKGNRSVNYDELGYHESPIFERDLLPIGKKIQGPMVIEEPASMTVVFPDQSVRRDEYGFLHIEFAQGK